MKTFEYKEIEGELTLNMLNEEGVKGWEFIKTDYRKRVKGEDTPTPWMETYFVQIFKKENELEDDHFPTKFF